MKNKILILTMWIMVILFELSAWACGVGGYIGIVGCMGLMLSVFWLTSFVYVNKKVFIKERQFGQ